MNLYNFLSETLLVMASIGVQITTKFATGRTQSRFYDRKYVKDIIINEAITMVSRFTWCTFLICLKNILRDFIINYFITVL